MEAGDGELGQSVQGLGWMRQATLGGRALDHYRGPQCQPHVSGMLASYSSPSHGAGRPLAIFCPPPSGAMGQLGSLPCLMGLSL